MRPGVALDPATRFVELTFGSRTVSLCRAHARIAENSGVKTFDDLRDLYGKGRRSYVPRRDPNLALSGDERRQSSGRRVTDRVAV